MVMRGKAFTKQQVKNELASEHVFLSALLNWSLTLEEAIKIDTLFEERIEVIAKVKKAYIVVHELMDKVKQKIQLTKINNRFRPLL